VHQVGFHYKDYQEARSAKHKIWLNNSTPMYVVDNIKDTRTIQFSEFLSFTSLQLGIFM
jgi:hypothetical protein